MKKWVALEIIILVATIMVAIALVPEIQNSSRHIFHQAVSQNNDSKTITFNLIPGQTVTGTLTYTGDTSGTWFQVYDPTDKGPPTLKRTNIGNHVNFNFTADMNGEYYIAIVVSDLNTQYINYDYTITSPILGLTYAALIELVIAIGVVLMLLIALLNKFKKN